METLYDILEVSRKASKEVIEKAYKTLAKKYHPDLQTAENKEIAEKQKELLELVHGKKDYFECDDEMEELRQSKKLLLVEHAKSEGVKQRINEFSEYIHSEDTQITEYNEKLVRKYIDQIKVYDDRFVICFKAKVEIVIKR